MYFHLLDKHKVLNELHLAILLNTILRTFRFSKNFSGV